MYIYIYIYIYIYVYIYIYIYTYKGKGAGPFPFSWAISPRPARPARAARTDRRNTPGRFSERDLGFVPCRESMLCLKVLEFRNQGYVMTRRFPPIRKWALVIV